MDLSQLKTFQLWECKKLENLPVEFGKLQSLVELDLSFSSELGVYLIQLWTCHNSRHLHCRGARNWRICKWSSGNFKAWWNWTYLVVSNWGVYPIELWTCYIIGVQESGEFAIGISKKFGELESSDFSN